ncbi:hypothetical protein [Streptosporangium sp. CA-115845]|uniref:hypothetical protein n=1 Tax=Streptosporangium sp. CA-115845 TaxID=3240071 RepID=UPI003D903712
MGLRRFRDRTDRASLGRAHGVSRATAYRYLDTRTRNALLRALHCLGERGFALLTQRRRTLQRITADPSRIGDIVKAALVLPHFERGYLK